VNTNHTFKQISPMMNHHRSINTHLNSNSYQNDFNQYDDQQQNNEKLEISEDEIYRDNDEVDASPKKSSTKSEEGVGDDVELMKTNLAKLKLSKNFDSLDNSPLDELNDDDFYDAIDDEIDRPPMIRSTSLKTGKSKNLGPESKKFVRFADAMGLDLAKVKNISQEDLPEIPASAFRDLKMCKREVKEEFFNNQFSCSPVRNQINYFNQASKFNSTFNSSKHPILSNGLISAGSDLLTTPSGNWPVLVPEFVQPFTQFNFLERVRNQKVCLESCVVSSIGNNLSVDCIIRVQNVSFEKVIMVRYTNNNWQTWLDSLASYIPNSTDGQTDKFSVKFYIKSLTKGQRVKFAIKYLANSTEYWDNFYGHDYCLLYKT